MTVKTTSAGLAEAKGKLQVAKEQVDVARANVAKTQSQIDDATLTSPVMPGRRRIAGSRKAANPERCGNGHGSRNQNARYTCGHGVYLLPGAADTWTGASNPGGYFCHWYPAFAACSPTAYKERM